MNIKKYYTFLLVFQAFLVILTIALDYFFQISTDTTVLFVIGFNLILFGYPCLTKSQEVYDLYQSDSSFRFLITRGRPNAFLVHPVYIQWLGLGLLVCGGIIISIMGIAYLL
jgi:hypothetical protein